MFKAKYKKNVLTFSRSFSPYIFDYNLNGCQLKRVDQIKDLGVIIDTKMTYNAHIDYIIAKANSLVGFIKSNKMHSDRIESVQRRFTKFVFRKMSWDFSPSYPARCQLLGILPLSNRRNVHEIMFIRDVLCYHIKCPSLLSLIQIYAPTRSLRERYFLFQQQHRTNYGMNEPISRAIRSFNDFCIDLELHYSRDRFKNCLFNLFSLD